MRLPKSTKILDLNLTPSPLGRLEWAHISIDDKGTGFSQMRRLESYQLLLILNGEGRYRDTMGREFFLRAGDLFVTTPDIPHQYGPLEGGKWDVLFFAFRGQLFDVWYRAGLLRSHQQPITLTPLEQWYHRFLKALAPRPIEQSHPVRQIIRLQAFLEEIPFDLPETKNPPEWLTIALNMLNADFTKPCHIEELAHACKLGVHTFRRKFIQFTGVAPAEYYHHIRMETACQLLASGKATIKEIAWQLGFYDAFHFSTAFKKDFGLSPKRFKENFANGNRGAARMMRDFRGSAAKLRSWNS